MKTYLDGQPKDNQFTPLSLVWHHVSMCYREARELDKALEAGLKALELDPNLVNAWCHIGYVYLDKKDFENANEASIKALSLEPSSKVALGLKEKLEKVQSP